MDDSQQFLQKMNQTSSQIANVRLPLCFFSCLMHLFIRNRSAILKSSNPFYKCVIISFASSDEVHWPRNIWRISPGSQHFEAHMREMSRRFVFWKHMFFSHGCCKYSLLILQPSAEEKLSSSYCLEFKVGCLEISWESQSRAVSRQHLTQPNHARMGGLKKQLDNTYCCSVLNIHKYYFSFLFGKLRFKKCITGEVHSRRVSWLVVSALGTLPISDKYNYTHVKGTFWKGFSPGKRKWLFPG